MIDVPVYVVANIVISDSDVYRKYEKRFFPILKKYQGQFITFDDSIDQFEGRYKEISTFRRQGTDTISIFKVKGQPPRN